MYRDSHSSSSFTGGASGTREQGRVWVCVCVCMCVYIPNYLPGGWERSWPCPASSPAPGFQVLLRLPRTTLPPPHPGSQWCPQFDECLFESFLGSVTARGCRARRSWGSGFSAQTSPRQFGRSPVVSSRQSQPLSVCKTCLPQRTGYRAPREGRATPGPWPVCLCEHVSAVAPSSWSCRSRLSRFVVSGSLHFQIHCLTCPFLCPCGFAEP